MTNKKTFLFLALIFSIVILSFNVSAWWLNGTVYNTDGVPMNNATVNVSIYQNGFTLVGSNSTYTNSTGGFNLSVLDDSNYQYKISLKHYHDNSSDYVDYTGSILPNFPYQALAGPGGSGIDTTFFLKEAGTLNITSVNATGSPGTFQYIVKDVATGSMIQANFEGFTSSANIVVPTDNNYSIEIFPQNSMPVSYEWNNWSASSDYNLSTGATGSNYNHTTRQMNKVFNTSVSFHRVTGYLSLENGTELAGYDFNILPYDFEAGNMISIDRPMPYNLSAFSGESDSFNSSNGFFNITIPVPTETARMLFMAIANSSSSHLIGYSNSSNISALTNLNFTMYNAMGSTLRTINQSDAANFSATISNTVYEQVFNVTNGTAAVTGTHIEATLDYSDYNATTFSMMADTSSSSSFYLPLINNTGLSSLNIFSHNYAPSTLTSLTTSSIIQENNNISLETFSPKGIDGNATGVKMALLKSNSTCDLPGFSQIGEGCFIGGNQQNVSGNPLSAIIGGGKVDFMMGLLSTGVIVKYVNVNMIASGPPSAMFDNSATTSTSGSFSSAMRFGSNGPKIYDYAMVSIPYETSQLNDSAQVNASIPNFYLDNSSGSLDWNTPIWNTSTNGTNATLLAGNYSHFSGSDVPAWQTLLDGSSCITNASNFNATNPCYLDTTDHRIWLRIPHFSGIDPSIVGSVVSTSSSSSSSGSSSSGGGGGGGSSSSNAASSSKTFSWDKISPGVAAVMKSFSEGVGIEEIQIYVKNQAQNVQISVTKYDSKPSEVSVNKSGKVYQYIHIDTTNLLDKLSYATVTFKVNKTWAEENSLSPKNISVYKFNETSKNWYPLETIYSGEVNGSYDYNVTMTSFSYFALGSKPGFTENATVSGEKSTGSASNETGALTGSSGWKWIVVVLIILGIGIGVYFYKIKNKNE